MRQILESEFQKEVKEQEGVVLVDFFTEWCGYCHMLTPILEEVDKEIEELKIVKVDAERCVFITEEYNIEFYPEMLIFKNGELVDHIDGYVPKDVIVKKVKEYL
jgi:thioredoxin 1